jgi:hypothetical protein
MKSIAVNEFEDLKIHDSLRKQLIGPVIIDNGVYIEFKWYKVLEWGDTSAIYIDVFRSPFKNNWSNFFTPKITMDWQWYYFTFPNGTSKFGNILPNTNGKKADDSSKYKLYHKQNEIADSMKFTVIPDRLFYFLQKGYFTVVEKKDTYTIVDFYESIANIVHKHTNENLSTMSAKVFVNDSLGVIIMPYDVPIELRNKK